MSPHFRCWLARMFLPTSRVVHVGGASTGVTEHARKPAYWFDSRTLYFMKRGGRSYAVLTTLAYLAGAIIWNTRRRDRTQRRSHCALIFCAICFHTRCDP